MPEFQHNYYGAEDFHNQQLRHYGLKKDSVGPASTVTSSVRPTYERNEANGMPVPPKRKAVPSSIRPPPPLHAQPAVSPRTNAAEGTRVIYTRADGRFDPATIRMEGPRYTPPASPVLPASRPAPTSPSRAPLKRTDSNDSKNSWRSRRDSAEASVRRLSSSLKEKAGIVAMDRNERVLYLRNKNNSAEHSTAPLKSKPGRSGSITKGEEFALKISKAIDPIRGRKADAMEACQRCYRPILDYATKGLCQQCHREAKAKERDVLEVATVVEPLPDPEPDSPDHGYVKLPSNRKIIRVRQTIYNDPGNPFSDDVENSPPDVANVPTVPTIHEQIPEEPKIDLARLVITESAPTPVRPQVRRGPGTTPHVVQPSPSVLYRRSQSIALPATRQWGDTEAEYVSPRAQWRMDNEATHRSEELPSSRNEARDTIFYGFYDDIMQDYRGRTNRQI